MPETPGDFYIYGLYTWDSLAMRSVSLSAGSELSLSACTHSSVVANVERSAEDVTEALTEEVHTEKEVAVRFFHPQTYRSDELFLTIFHVEEV